MPAWLNGRFQPLPDVADWDALAAGLDVEAHFASVVALAAEVLDVRDPWAEVADDAVRLTAEQRDQLR